MISEKNNLFTKMVDELVKFSEYDPELKENIRWSDEQAKKKGISFYDQVFETLYKHKVYSRVKDQGIFKN